MTTHPSKSEDFNTQMQTQMKNDPREAALEEASKILLQTIEEGGRIVLKIPPGIGKTTSAINTIVDLLARLWTIGGRSYGFTFCAPTHATKNEFKDKLDTGLMSTYGGSSIAYPPRMTENCAYLKNYAKWMDIHPNLGKSFCDQCPNRVSCPVPRQKAEYFQSIHADTSMPRMQTHANLWSHGFEKGRVTVIDEMPKSAWKTNIIPLDAFAFAAQLTEEELEDLKDWQLQLDPTNPLAKKGKRPSAYDSQLLEQVLPSIQIRPYDDSVYEKYKDLVNLDAEEAKLRQKLPTSDGWKALENAFEFGPFHGCALTLEGIEVTTFRTPRNIEQARAVVLLDATADEHTCQAVFGSDVVFYDLGREIEFEGNHKLIRIESNICSRSRIEDGSKKQRLMRSIGEMTRSLGFAPEETVWIGHKRLMTHEAGAMKVYEEFQQRGGDVINLNGTLSRGSNLFEDRTCVISESYKVPQHVLISHAEALQDAIIRGGGDLDWDEACRSTTLQLEVAPEIQGIHRIRPLRKDRSLTVVVGKSDTLLDLGQGMGLLPDDLISLPESLALLFAGDEEDIAPRTGEDLLRFVTSHRGWCCPARESVEDLLEYTLEIIFDAFSDLATSWSVLQYIYCKTLQTLTNSGDCLQELIRRSDVRNIAPWSTNREPDPDCSLIVRTRHPHDKQLVVFHPDCEVPNWDEISKALCIETPRQILRNALQSVTSLPRSKNHLSEMLVEVCGRSKTTWKRLIAKTEMSWKDIIASVQIAPSPLCAVHSASLAPSSNLASSDAVTTSSSEERDRAECIKVDDTRDAGRDVTPYDSVSSSMHELSPTPQNPTPMNSLSDMVPISSSSSPDSPLPPHEGNIEKVRQVMHLVDHYGLCDVRSRPVLIALLSHINATDGEISAACGVPYDSSGADGKISFLFAHKLVPLQRLLDDLSIGDLTPSTLRYARQISPHLAHKLSCLMQETSSKQRDCI